MLKGGMLVTRVSHARLFQELDAEGVAHIHELALEAFALAR